MISSVDFACVQNARPFTAAKNSHKCHDKNWISIWIHDKDKICTDGKDDGKISFKEKIISFGKGIIGLVKGFIKHPITTILTIGTGVGLTVLTGGAILPILVALGIVTGVSIITLGGYKAIIAKTDGEAKHAWETMGNGTFAVICSALGAKSSLKAAAKAGVKAADGTESLNIFRATAKTFKVIPDAYRVSVINGKGNFLTYTTGQIHANSNATRNGVEVGYQSDGKKLEAYKIDLNGSVDEVLAKNPGLSYDADAGKYYVQTSWGAKSYVDPKAPKGYMFLKYGPGDNNAVEGAEFFDTYVDNNILKTSGVKSYVAPSKLDAGQIIGVSKEAPARFKIVPEGTKYVGAEGPGVVQPKSVLRIDGQGRPYQSTVQFMLDRVKLTPEQIEILRKVDPEAVNAFLTAKK